MFKKKVTWLAGLLAMVVLVSLAGFGKSGSVVGKWKSKASGRTVEFAADGTGTLEITKEEREAFAKLGASLGNSSLASKIGSTMPFTWKIENDLLTWTLSLPSGRTSEIVYNYRASSSTLTLRKDRKDREVEKFDRVE